MTVYACHVIKSFRDADTERLFRRESVKRFRAIERSALRKLDMLDAAENLHTLATLPGNRLERLTLATNSNKLGLGQRWGLSYFFEI